MRFVPAPHFAYFKVLNGITSKLLILNRRKAEGETEVPSPRASAAASARALGLHGPVGDLNVRRLQPAGTRRGPRSHAGARLVAGRSVTDRTQPGPSAWARQGLSLTPPHWCPLRRGHLVPRGPPLGRLFGQEHLRAQGRAARAGGCGCSRVSPTAHSIPGDC